MITSCFGYLRSLQLERVYGKTAIALEKQMRERKEWKRAADTVKGKVKFDISAKPDETEPYLVILVDEFDTNAAFWDVLARSGEEKTSLNGVNTVVLCQYMTKTASYGPTSAKTGTTTGTSEFVRISYVNADTGECCRWEAIGKDLPGSASNVPHYKVSYNKLLSHIKETLKEMDN